VLDDATDPTAATKNIKKLISENKVDVVVGSSTTSSLAMMDVAVETRRR
jgi:branched-chain amino acid transport system substrate-binding protein